MRLGTVTHIASTVVHVGTLMRQRCGWCGAVLIDVDVARVMVMTSEGRDPEPSIPTWEVGSLVAIDGGASWTVDPREDGLIPEDACARLDPEVTL